MGIAMQIEYTDTFGGDANYSWCRRAEMEFKDGTSERYIIRALKAEVGMVGRHRKTNFGEEIRLDEVGACRVAFITEGRII